MGVWDFTYSDGPSQIDAVDGVKAFPEAGSGRSYVVNIALGLVLFSSFGSSK